MSIKTGKRPGRKRGAGAADQVAILTIDNTLIDDVNLTVTYWFENVTSGDYTLSYGGQTTAAIEWDDAAAAVETAFELLSTITAVTVTGTGTEQDPFSILFVTPGSSLTTVTGASSLLQAWSDADRA